MNAAAPAAKTDRYIGLMSGTSVDAVDAALLAFDATRARLLATHSEPVPEALRDALFELRGAATVTLDELGRLDTELGRLFGRAAVALMDLAGVAAGDVAAIGSHGQTVRHRPQGEAPFTLQIGDPNLIAALSGVTTVADFRRRDVATGGQGAPLAPAFHRWLLAGRPGRAAVLNLGGIANLTLIDSGTLAGGFDTGPANTLLDLWHRRHRGLPFDPAGAWAAGGHVHAGLLAALRRHPYLQRPPPKSTGFEDFGPTWLDAQLAGLAEAPAPRDVMATLAEFTAVTVADALRRHWPDCAEVHLCGGGVHNTDLVARLQRHLPGAHLTDTAALGIAPDWIEAAAFAWLARARLRDEAVDLRTVTGGNGPVTLGGIY